MTASERTALIGILDGYLDLLREHPWRIDEYDRVQAMIDRLKEGE